MNLHLTARQDQVLRLVAEGFTNQQIADRLFIGPATVERHVEEIRYALDARNRTHAVWRATQVGCLTPEVKP
jgi:DNA-binding NarL/FixJ family response regulator